MHGPCCRGMEGASLGINFHTSLRMEQGRVMCTPAWQPCVRSGPGIGPLKLLKAFNPRIWGNKFRAYVFRAPRLGSLTLRCLGRFSVNTISTNVNQYTPARVLDRGGISCFCLGDGYFETSGGTIERFLVIFYTRAVFWEKRRGVG